MTDVESWIEAALLVVRGSANALTAEPPSSAQKLVARAKELYVNGSPRSWWLSPKIPFRVLASGEEDGSPDLEALIPASGECWFIPETGEEVPPVYRGTPKGIALVLQECPLFEYYVLPLDMAWLLIENDHNEVLLAELPQPPK